MADQIEAYCVKCRTTRTMQDATVETNERGRRVAKGTCPECGTRMNKFLPSENK